MFKNGYANIRDNIKRMFQLAIMGMLLLNGLNHLNIVSSNVLKKETNIQLELHITNVLRTLLKAR